MSEALITSSADLVAQLQRLYGTADYTQARGQKATFWSYVQYLSAGMSQINFFGSAIGQNGITLQDTNMPKASSFGQNHFLLREIHTDWYIQNANNAGYAGLDADTLVSDLLGGFADAGTLTFTIGTTKYVEVPKPFQLVGPADGRPRVIGAGLAALTLTTGTPNTFTSLVTVDPYAELPSRSAVKYTEDPMLFIEAEQNFACRIDYPSGAVPVIATNVVNDTTNPLKVGVRLEGIQFVPIQ